MATKKSSKSKSLKNRVPLKPVKTLRENWLVLKGA
jgi:hypothetical protein